MLYEIFCILCSFTIRFHNSLAVRSFKTHSFILISKLVDLHSFQNFVDLTFLKSRSETEIEY